MIGDDVAVALPEMRAQAESLMVTPCRVRHPTGETTDPLTGRAIPIYAPVYEGRCKVQDTGATAVRDVESGASTVTIAPLRVDFPVTAPPVHAGDLIEILAGTPERPGAVQRQLRAERGHIKTWQTAQRVPVTEVGGLS